MLVADLAHIGERALAGPVPRNAREAHPALLGLRQDADGQRGVRFAGGAHGVHVRQDALPRGGIQFAQGGAPVGNGGQCLWIGREDYADSGAVEVYERGFHDYSFVILQKISAYILLSWYVV